MTATSHHGDTPAQGRLTHSHGRASAARAATLHGGCGSGATEPGARRGSALVLAVVVMILLGLIVATAVTSGTRNGSLTLYHVDGTETQYAADSAVALAAKEIFDNVDRDGNGTIGSVSSSNLTTTGTALAGITISATAASSGSTTTITARGTTTHTRRAIRVALASPPTAAATVLFVVVNSASLDAQESAKKALMESWGYTVVPISESQSAAAFTAAALTSSVCYVSETVLSTNVSTKLTGFVIGVVTEESSLSDELGMSTSMTTFTGATIDIINTSHYITSTLASGVRTIFSSGQPVRYLSGTLGGITTLGRQPSTTNATLAVMERGDTLTPSGTAAGRRVYLPFGNTGYDVNSLTADGLTIMRRAIEWCVLPVAHWTLDDASGTTAVDCIGGSNGALSGGTWTTGHDSGGLSLNGSTNYVSIANHAKFQITNALTIAGWVKAAATWPNNTDWANIVLRKGDSNPNNWQLCIWQGRVALVLNTNDAYCIAANTTLAVGAWYHVAGTWDGATVRLYVNGALDNTPSSYASTLPTDTRSVYLGGRTGSTDILNGTIDDVRLYSRALTAAEVAALALGGRPTITQWTQVDPNN